MATNGTSFSLEGKTAIVTGASYGLGVTFAGALAGAGANVVLAARSKDKVEAEARRLEDSGAGTLAVQCDVGDSSSVRDMVTAAWDKFGRVDVLVNNAGVSAEAGVVPENIPDELFEQTIRINLLGTWYCCRTVGERMLRDGKGGSLINISSIMGVAGGQNTPTAYHSSKAAVINLTRSLAISWADRGVRVNAIAPGWFPSEMTAGWFAIPQFLERFQKSSPMQRVGDPSELVGPLLFLASDASSFVTGQTLCVDGGLSASVGALAYDDTLLGLQAAVMPDGLGARIMPSG
jgi:NAD(P)-dependent dehydrogenase (short-subunit alcohol dehydrogenase family)